MFCAVLCVHSSFAIVFMGKRELVTFFVVLGPELQCLLKVGSVPWVGLKYVIVVFPDHTHSLFVCEQDFSLECVTEK